jgi:hypothetical protein
MLCGALLSAACGIVMVASTFLSYFGAARSWDVYSSGWYNLFSLGFLPGNLLFVWGFVLYALKIARLALHAEELERLTLSMAAEINRRPVPESSQSPG